MSDNEKILAKLLDNTRLELNANQKKFIEFLDNTQEGIVVLNLDTLRFSDYNSNALSILAYTGKEILERNILDISPVKQPCGRLSGDKAYEYLVRVLNGEKLSAEWQIVSGTGQLVTLEVRARAVSSMGTQQLYMSITDITRRKEIEDKLKAQDRLLNEIVFMQSHQVRQPLSSILGLINLFNFNNPEDPRNAEVLLKIKTASNLFDGIIHDILDKISENSKAQIFK